MANNAIVKKKKTTIQKYRFWHRWYLGLKAAEFSVPLIPFGVILGINWSDWFGKEQSEGWSIGLGFGMLIVATVLAITEIMKKDELVKTKVSFLFYVSIVFVLVGFSFKLLASIMNTMGDMFLYVSCGIVGAGGVDETNQMAIKPRMDFYKSLVDENGLDKSSAKKMDDTDQAKKEGEEAKKERRNFL